MFPDFNKLNDRYKWEIYEYLQVNWHCPHCKSLDGPQRCQPFPGLVMECEDCGYELTRRTGGGQGDPFNWVF